MKTRILVSWLLLPALLFAVRSHAVQPTSREHDAKAGWLGQNLSTNAAAWPFSFVYDQRPSSEFLPTWTCERTGQTAGAGRAQSTLTFRDPATALRGRCEITEFVGHAALEWVLHFENRGPRDTSLLEAIRALDIRLPAGTSGLTLRYARGATCSFDDFQPLTEIRWVEGLYAFWDELLRRHPHLLIDNCASGGRRIDLEAMSRSVPLWRTDFPGDPLGKQCHTYGLSFWVPLNGTGAVNPAHDSDYALRSSLSSTLAFGLFGNGDAPQGDPPRSDFPFARAKAALAQCRELQRYFVGDYYPLTSYSKARDVWLAWQFDLPEDDEGMVQAFRREQSPYESARFPLRGLRPDAQYRVTDVDSPEGPQTFTGHELMTRGLPVRMRQSPGAFVVIYRQQAR